MFGVIVVKEHFRFLELKNWSLTTRCNLALYPERWCGALNRMQFSLIPRTLFCGVSYPSAEDAECTFCIQHIRSWLGEHIFVVNCWVRESSGELFVKSSLFPLKRKRKFQREKLPLPFVYFSSFSTISTCILTLISVIYTLDNIIKYFLIDIYF